MHEEIICPIPEPYRTCPSETIYLEEIQQELGVIMKRRNGAGHSDSCL
jgi:hypothetical protein